MLRVRAVPRASSSATRFSNCLIDRSNSGSFGNAVIARSQSLASKAGLPGNDGAGRYIAADSALRVHDRVLVNR